MRSFEPIARLTELSPRSIENQPNVASVEMLLQRNVCYVRSGYSCSINQGKMKTYEFIYFWRDCTTFTAMRATLAEISKFCIPRINGLPINPLVVSLCIKL